MPSYPAVAVQEPKIVKSRRAEHFGLYDDLRQSFFTGFVFKYIIIIRYRRRVE